jgi:predicted transcriptional regulator
MARKKTPTLTEAEIRLMNVVWDKGKATVNEVIEALPRKERPAYNSVLTIMRILEDKGYLKHVKEGRAHVYRPRVSRDQAQRKVVRHLVKRFFDDSPEQLVLSILENEKLGKDEIDRLKAMIRESERK